MLLSVLVLGFGVWLSVRTRFCQRLCLRLSLAALRQRSGKGVSPFEALGAALSGTMGVGSLIAVSAALSLGGPGALLWMWIGGFFSMAIKYAEVYLCVRYRDRAQNGSGGGTMTVLANACRRPAAARLYAFFCLCACLLTIGNTAQVSAVCVVLRRSLQLSAPACVLLLCALLLPLLFFSPDRLSRLCGVLFPPMALLYLCGCVLCLYVQRQALPAVFASVFREGLSPAAFLSGTGACALRYGIMRGLFSNEAGLGTSAMAHSLSDARDPRLQAGLGMAEVFINTHVLCTLTALVLLCAGEVSPSGSDTAVVLRAFFLCMGRPGSRLVSVMLLFFGLSTVPVWLLYGKRAACFLFPRAKQKTVRAAVSCAYLLFALLGSGVQPSLLWNMTDALNLGLCIPNLYMLFLCRKDVISSIWEK